MTTPPVYLAVDAGTAAVKIATDLDADDGVTVLAASGDWSRQAVGALARTGAPAERVCLAVPEAWLDASVAGTAALEALRAACAEELGITEVAVAGQLAAVAALTARERGPGRYLICDIGAAGVRTAALDVTGETVRIVAAHSFSDGGWRDFDQSVRALPLGGGGDPLPADWFRQACEQQRRALVLFQRALSVSGVRESPVYTIAGPGGKRSLLTGQLIECFALTRERIQAGVAQVLGGRPPDVAVLAGGLGWLPLAATVLADAAGVEPVTAEPAAAARGTLLFASGRVSQPGPGELVSVAVPAHRVRNGQLEEVTVPLRWNEPFTRPEEGPLFVVDSELTIDVGGRRLTVGFPGLRPGPCLVGLRSGWSGEGAVVVRPDTGSGSPVVASIGAVTVG